MSASIWWVLKHVSASVGNLLWHSEACLLRCATICTHRAWLAQATCWMCKAQIHAVLGCCHHHSALGGCQEQHLWAVFCLAELVRKDVLILSILDTISTSTVLHAWVVVFVSVIGCKVIQCAESPWQRRYCQCVEYSPSTACWRRGEVLHDWRTGQGTGPVTILWSVTRSACSRAGWIRP